MAVREKLSKEPLNPQQVDEESFIEYKRRSKSNFQVFYRGLIIPSASGPKIFDDCIAKHQIESFNVLEPSLRAVRNGTKPLIKRFWLERTKKAAKDADLAICLVWVIAFTTRPILAQVSAANQQQAGIIKRRIKSLLHYNPWLNDYIRIQLNKVISSNNLGEVIIEATGSSGAKQGDTPDLLILNELVHVEKWGVNETHMNNADGVPNSVVIISTNAGIKGTKSHGWKKNAENNPGRWKVLPFKGIAPWIDPSDVADAKRRDPIGSEFKRLWKGEWVSGLGDALSEEAIDACFVLPSRLARPETGWEYLASFDLGISHDHAAVVCIGVNRAEQKVRVARLMGIKPSLPNDQGKLEVDESMVERLCIKYHRMFKIGWFGYDPAAGGSFLAQRLRKHGIPMREVSFASRVNQNAMADALVQFVTSGKLECYEDAEGRLRRDFGKFSIVPRAPSGYKLEAVSDEWGHADVGVALAISLPEALKMVGSLLLFDKEDIIYQEDEEYTDDELQKDMPAELLDICDAYDELGLNNRGFPADDFDFG